MDASPEEVPAEYTRITRRNCSLTRRGRLLFLALVVSNLFIVSVLGALVGAWPIAPFAGLEVAGLALALYLVGLRDGDFERLTIFGQRVLVESRERGRDRRVEFNRAWAMLVERGSGRGVRLALRSHGREVSIGRLMSDEERRDWSRELATRLRTSRSR